MVQEGSGCFTGTLSSWLPWSPPQAVQAGTASLAEMWDQPAPVTDAKDMPSMVLSGLRSG